MMSSVRTEIAKLLDAERRERAAADEAKANDTRDRHVMLAERYADQAWSLAENDRDCPHVPSTVWAKAA